MTDEELMLLAARLAGRAAEAIMAVRAAGFVVESKRDHTPVTAADRIAEALIVDALKEATPDIPVVAEEAMEAGLEQAPAARFWLVDPLDGTREFARGDANFAVNVGLVVAGMPHLGAVALPAFGEVFRGLVGVGAWKRDAAGERPIRARRVPAEGAVVMASRHYAKDTRIDDFARAHRAGQVVNIGSAAKFCRIAEGAADLYPRFGETMEWDTAAPDAVLRAAGGGVADWQGAALRYGKRAWLNPPFLATGPR